MIRPAPHEVVLELVGQEFPEDNSEAQGIVVAVGQVAKSRGVEIGFTHGITASAYAWGGQRGLFSIPGPAARLKTDGKDSIRHRGRDSRPEVPGSKERISVATGQRNQAGFASRTTGKALDRPGR